jgi:DNA repair exonuclease SbcCD ATPase subunit
MAALSLTLIEIIVLMLGAIMLGITIHFFIVSRKSLKITALNASGKIGRDLEQWKLKYFNDIEIKDKELSLTRQQLAETEENNNINSIEADEMRRMNKKLQGEIETLRKLSTENSNNSNSFEIEELQRQNKLLQAEIESLRKITVSSAGSVSEGDKKPVYMEQLRQAQNSLMEHNQKVNLLLSQIEMVKETEEKQQEIQNANKELTTQINDLKYLLSQKEEEIKNTRKKEHLTTEMTSRLDSAYNEFNVLQDKIQKLEAQVISSKRLSIDYDDLKEAQTKMVRDFEDQKMKYHAAASENQQLQAQLEEVEDHLREANFQRQQLQKRVAYLEELNNDMQAVAEANKKLESQLKRVGELESKLNMVAEERDELARKQYKAP